MSVPKTHRQLIAGRRSIQARCFKAPGFPSGSSLAFPQASNREYPMVNGLHDADSTPALIQLPGTQYSGGSFWRHRYSVGRKAMSNIIVAGTGPAGMLAALA